VAAKLHICVELIPRMKNIENIIFDLGGVIINLDIPATTNAFAGLAKKYGIDNFNPQPEHQIFKDFETGAISSQQFRDELRNFVHAEITDDEIDFAWNAMLLDLPKSRLDLLLQLKEKYKTFLLSNTNEIHYTAFNKILFDSHGEKSLAPFFHKDYYSHLIGRRKPNADAFQLILDENDLVAEHTLFLDDTPQHLEGANRLGIQTMLVTAENTVHNIFKDF
jgi:putative hydrolase of the HAD superfamily